MQGTIELDRRPMNEGAIDELPRGLVVADTYRLGECIGAGGMADVYEAEHVRLGNRVALKVLRTSARADSKGFDRFRHEARRVAALSSEHVVKVFDCGELPNGMPFLVMERLWGEDLRSLLAREGPLPVRRAVELAIGACRGLAAVHAAGLVHRDLKPANLFVVRRWDGTDFCKILDFGVAKTLVSDTTASGALLGTIRYMAPEQLENPSAARAAADVYAVGAILYESLTGVPPQTGETVQALMFGILNRDIVPPSELRPIPPELETVVSKALARDSSKRFPSAEAMARALAPFGSVAQPPLGAESHDDLTLDEARGASVPMRAKSARGALVLTLGFVTTLVFVGAVSGSVSKKELDPAPSAPAVAKIVAAARAPATTSEPPLTRQAALPPTSLVVPQPDASLVAPLPERSTSAKPRAKAPTKPRLTEPAPRADRFDARDPYAE